MRVSGSEPTVNTTLIDGSPADQIPADDRGLAYGDGLFETLAVRDGLPCLWERHLARLREGAARLAIPLPDPRLLEREALALCAGRARAVLKLTLTRAGGGRGYRPAAQAAGRRILSLSDWPGFPEPLQAQGVRVRLCQTRCATSPQTAGLKHLGRLEQVLARAEWDDPGIPEGVMLDADGLVVEGTQSNLFLDRGGHLFTPLLDRAGVAGVVRGLVMDEAAALGDPVREVRVPLAALDAADALYLTNSLIGVWRVASFREHRFALHLPMHPAIVRSVERVYAP